MNLNRPLEKINSVNGRNEVAVSNPRGGGSKFPSYVILRFSKNQKNYLAFLSVLTEAFRSSRML
jgi:hypothetical protein